MDFKSRSEAQQLPWPASSGPSGISGGRGVQGSQSSPYAAFRASFSGVASERIIPHRDLHREKNPHLKRLLSTMFVLQVAG